MTEIVRFPETYEICFFFRKKRRLFEKKYIYFLKKIVKGDKIAVKIVSIDNISSECLFLPELRAFRRNQKVFKFGKSFRKFAEDSTFFEKKDTFVLLKAIFSKTKRRRICRCSVDVLLVFPIERRLQTLQSSPMTQTRWY